MDRVSFYDQHKMLKIASVFLKHFNYTFLRKWNQMLAIASEALEISDKDSQKETATEGLH